MAKQSSIQKNNDRKEKSTRYWKYRKLLRERAIDPKISIEDRIEARTKLEKLPRDTSPLRVVNRCLLTGRPRGNYRKFGLSRIAFRQLALDGKLPGVTKASW